jgi:DNA-binding MarR family transcriptional regulator
VIGADKNRIPAEILNDSVLVHLAAAYFSVAKRLDQKTHCSQTRGFIMSTLRRGAERNQNQIAVLLGFDRTVVHRAIKSMIREGLASQKKAKSGKALLIQLTAKGNKYRERLIKERRAAEEKLRTELTSAERPNLLRLLKLVSELKF